MDIELSDNAKKEIVNYSKYLAKTTKFDKEKIQELTTKFEEWNESIKNMKSVKTYITESKMISLVDYLKKMVG